MILDMKEAVKILVVDDEETLCEALKFNLEAEGYYVDVAMSAEEALTHELSEYSLILLDIMMDGISGTQLASILKKKESTAHIPIIFCTAKDAEDDMINGLELGADDYITKPYSIRNVLARVKTVLRRVSPNDETVGELITEYNGLKVFKEQKLCLVDGEEVRLPRKEFEILSMLLSHPGRIFSREELLSKIWPQEVVVLDRVCLLYTSPSPRDS